MKHQYDWSKLDAGWSYEPTFGGALRDSIGVTVAVEYIETSWDDCGQFTIDARAQLAKCRVEPKPEPSPEYNWNKLEGTGWRVGNGAYITNGKFNYWYTTWPKLEALFKFDANEALAAENAAFEAVEKCRIDWKEEVMSTCRDTGLSTVLDIRGTVAVIGEVLYVDAFHRMRLNSVRLDIDKLLAISLVIERLKKLGWRES